MEAKIPSTGEIAKAIPSLEDVKNALPTVDSIKAAIPSVDELKAALPSYDDMRNALPTVDSVRERLPSYDQLRDALPGADDFHLPATNDFLRPEVLGGAALIGVALLLPSGWRTACGVLGGALIGYGLFVRHGRRYPSETHGRDHYSTYGENKFSRTDDDLIDSRAMDSFPTSDPPATY